MAIYDRKFLSGIECSESLKHIKYFRFNKNQIYAIDEYSVGIYVLHLNKKKRKLCVNWKRKKHPKTCKDVYLLEFVVRLSNDFSYLICIQRETITDVIAYCIFLRVEREQWKIEVRIRKVYKKLCAGKLALKNVQFRRKRKFLFLTE